MAITITRGLDALVGVFNRQTIEFTVPTGTTGVKCTISSTDFIPLKLSTGAVDTYMMDVSDILKYVLGFPTPTNLSVSCTISIASTGQTTVTTTGVLCGGYDQIGDPNTLLNYVYPYGVRGVVYHNGYISFYNKGAAGTYAFVINTVSYNYTIVNGYNRIALHTSQNISGLMAQDTLGLELNLNYKAETGTEIQWIDGDGRISAWTFRLLGRENVVENGDRLPSYYTTHTLTTEKSIIVGKTKSLRTSLDCIAVNYEHFEQLTRIKESLYVTISGVRCSVVSSDSIVNDCKQNLHFSITLEQEAYAPNY